MAFNPERAEKKRLIRKAYNYNSKARRMASCNSMYMGSMATCMMYHHLGADWPNIGLTQALNQATDAQLDAALDYVQPYLKRAGG